MGFLGSETGGADREGEYNAIELMRKNVEGTRTKIKFLGINDGSGKNPGGVKMSRDEFIVTMRLKDPSALIHSGKSLTDPVDESEVDPALTQVVPGYAGMSTEEKQIWHNRYNLLQMMSQDPQLSGDTLAAMAENDPTMADAIAFWKGKGVIDKMNNQNAGQVAKVGGKFGKIVVENRIMSELTPEEEAKYEAQYEQETAGPKSDPKNVKVEHIGKGRIRTTVLNPDGSVAAQFVEGEVALPSGQKLPIVVNGGTNADFQKAQDTADGVSGLFDDAARGKSAAPKSSAAEEDGVATGEEEEDPLKAAGGTSLDDTAQGGGGAEDETMTSDGDGADAEGASEDVGETGGATDGAQDLTASSSGQGSVNTDFVDEDGNGLNDISEASAANVGTYSPEDLAAVDSEGGLDSTGDPIEADFDENGNPVLFNQGDQGKEHYYDKKGNAILTGGRGLPGGTTPEGYAHEASDEYTGTETEGSGPSGDGKPDEDAQQGQAKQVPRNLEDLGQLVPPKYRRQALNFWADVLVDDPNMTPEELISMLPDEVQAEMNKRSGVGKAGKKQAPKFEDYGSTAGEEEAAAPKEAPAAKAKKSTKKAAAPAAKSKSKDEGSSRVDELLALLEEHPELADQIMDAIDAAKQGAA
jgi:hypothetical protein